MSDGESKKLLEYRYDENGNISEATGNTGTSTYKYDNSGNILNYTDIFGKTINYTYDERGNLSKLEVAGEPPTVYTYDSEDRIISVIYGDNKTVSYEYVGNTTITHLPDNKTIVEKYNDSGDLVDKTYTDNVGNIIYKISLEYDGEDRISKRYVVLSKDNKESDTKESALTDQDTLTASSENVLSVEDTVSDNSGNNTDFIKLEYRYSYTDNSQLKSESITGDIGTKDISYTYDNAGNRTSETIKTGDKEEVTTFTYDESNRLIKKQSPKKTTIYSYDKNGNRISAVSNGEKFSYTYDINDNLTGIKKNDVTIFEAIYDAMGERVLTKELNSDGTLESKYRLNDVSFEDTQVLSVYNDSSKTDLIYGNERTVELSTGTESIFITDEKESVLGRIGEENIFYTPFGDNEDTNFIDTQKALITSFGFDGEWKDSTGLYYLRARYYDPNAGVFLSEDSVSGDIESATSLNGYSFVENDPVNYTDPSGNTRNKGKSTGRGNGAKGKQVSKKTTASTNGKASNKSKSPKLKMPKISPKAKAQSKRQDKPKNSGRRLGKQNIRQSTNLSRSLGRRTANSYSKNHSKNVNANVKRSGRNTANRFASSIRPRPVVAKRVNEKSRKSFMGVINKKIPPKRNNNSVDTAKAKKAFQDINKNNEDFAKRAKKNPILYLYSAYGAIDSLNTNIKKLKALEEAGVIKLPNIGIHYDNLRNTVIRESTKAGNSVYAANIPIISNGLGRFLGATNMPKNAGLMSTIGAYYRGVYIKGFLGTADGIYSTVAHPIKTVEGLTDIIVNPGMLVKAVKNHTNEKIIHGSSEDRAELLGHAAFEIGLAVVANGSVKSGKGAKKAIVSSKAADIADDVSDISNGSKTSSKISGIGDEIAGGSNIKQPSKIIYPSKAAEIGEQAGDMAGIDKKINPIKPPLEIPEPNKLPIEAPEPNKLPIEVPEPNKSPIEVPKPKNPSIELPKTEKTPIEIPESKNPPKLPEVTETPKLPEPQKQINKTDDIAKEKPLSKENVKPEDKKEVPKAIEGATAAGKPGTTFLSTNGSKTKYENNSKTVFEIVEQNSKNINNAIQSRLSNKKDIGKFLEGKVADYIMNNTNETIKKIGAKVKVLSGEKIKPEKIGADIGELDIMTDNYLIEVKRDVQNVKFSQMERYLDMNNDEYINVGDKKVILYIDSGLEGASVKELEAVEKSRELGAIIVTDLEELGRILR